jgi:filamentous hemagglutinin
MTGAFSRLFNDELADAQRKAEIRNIIDSMKIDESGCLVGEVTICVGPAAIEKVGIKVTSAMIEKVLATDVVKTTQKAVSLPAIQRYVDKLLNGEIAPAIKMDADTIVDGVHRYIAGRLVGKPPAINPGTAASSRAAQPISEIKVDPADWGNF